MDKISEIEVLDPTAKKLVLRKIYGSYHNIYYNYILFMKDNPGLKNIGDDEVGRIWFYVPSTKEYHMLPDEDEYPYLISYLKQHHIKYRERRNEINIITIYVPKSYIKIITPDINEIEVLDPSQKIKLKKVFSTSKYTGYVILSKFNPQLKFAYKENEYAYDGPMVFYNKEEGYSLANKNEYGVVDYLGKYGMLGKDNTIKPQFVQIVDNDGKILNEIEVLDPSLKLVVRPYELYDRPSDDWLSLTIIDPAINGQIWKGYFFVQDNPNLFINWRDNNFGRVCFIDKNTKDVQLPLGGSVINMSHPLIKYNKKNEMYCFIPSHMVRFLPKPPK